MAKINLKLPEEIQKVEYLNSLVLKTIDYREDFEPFVETLIVNVEFIISSSIKEQVANSLTEKNGVFELTIPIKRYWISPTKLAPPPSPKDVYNSVVFALDSTLKDFNENNILNNFEDDSEDDSENETRNKNI
ncbi:hypothetical protein [Flavobacterium branchiicola]|uniref:Uncharacterized protein n=1 Tax=Flavobacterium branchiicola TaxID=1114875 RepID=A0ABV9PE27_9FLAO|nr:hypothetical protein [Flavobacterium branchiicola]MBS7253321.1 hypothetical protein [Flavobacterium branchiicola]